MQGRTTTFDGDPTLWHPVRVRKTRKGRTLSTRAMVRVETPIAASARRPGGIRPDTGDALELALFVATLAATGLLHLGALALVW